MAATAPGPACTLLGVRGVAPGPAIVSIVADLGTAFDFAHLTALVVFGSVARGDHDGASDVDVLAVVDGQEAASVARANARAAESRLALLVLTPTGLLREAEAHPSFVTHILDEGLVVHAGPGWDDLLAALRRRTGDGRALAHEVRNRAADLAPLTVVDRFAASPITFLSRVYAISRSVVIARLLEVGIHEYGWQRVFDRYADVRPDLRQDLSALKSLRPYYAHVQARAGAQQPVAHVDAADLARMLGSAQRIAG